MIVIITVVLLEAAAGRSRVKGLAGGCGLFTRQDLGLCRGIRGRGGLFIDELDFQLSVGEQFAAVMQRYANYKGYPADETGDLSQLIDAGQISDWARENVSWAVGAGLIVGRDNGALDPQGSATRAEAAAILQRFIEK